MSSKKRISTSILNRICFVLAVLSALGVLLSFLGFRKSVQDIQLDQFKSTLRETAHHNMADANNLINTLVNQLNAAGTKINEHDDFSEPEIKEILELTQQTSMFDFVSLATPDGTGYDNAGQTFDISNREYFQTAMTGHVAFSEVMDSHVIPGDRVQIIAHPIRNPDKTVRGVVSGILNIGASTNINSLFVHENDDSIHIVDSCGEYIVHLHEDNWETSSDNFWINLEQSSLSESEIAQIRENFESRQEGNFTFTQNGEQRYACHMPIGPNKWQLVYSVSSASMDQVVHSLHRLDIKNAAIAGICHMTLTLCVAWYFIQANMKVRAAHQATKRNTASIRIALEHSKHIIFEYDQETRTISLKTKLRNVLFDRAVISSAPESLLAQNVIAPDSIPTFQALFETIKTQISSEGDIQILTNSKEYWYHISLNNVFDEENKISATVGIVEDITEEKEKDAKMARRLQIQQTLIANALTYAKVDLDHNLVTEFNGEESHMSFQYFLMERLNKKVFPDHVPSVAQALSLETLREAYRQGKESIEVEFMMDCDGTLKWVSCVVYGLYSDDHAGAIFVITDIDDRKRLEIALKAQAERDGLTGLYNSATIRSKVNEILSQQHTLHGQQIFILIDLDNYKQINDTFGHNFGDQVLIDVAAVLSARFRSGDLVGRLGGDEFLVFLRNVNSFDGVASAIDNLCQAIRKTYRDGDKEVTLSASIGISSAPDDGTTFEALYQKSDIALYQIKKAGKNGFKRF